MNTQIAPRPIKIGTLGPWDEVQAVIDLRPGLQHVYALTDHGLYVTPELNAQIPEPLRLEDGWYGWMSGEVRRVIWVFQNELYNYLGGDTYAQNELNLNPHLIDGELNSVQRRELFQQHLHKTIINDLGPSDEREWFIAQPLPEIQQGPDLTPTLGYHWEDQSSTKAQQILDDAQIEDPGSEIDQILQTKDQIKATAIMQHLQVLYDSVVQADLQWTALVNASKYLDSPVRDQAIEQLEAPIQIAASYSFLRDFDQDPDAAFEIARQLHQIVGNQVTESVDQLIGETAYLGETVDEWYEPPGTSLNLGAPAVQAPTVPGLSL